MRIVAPALRFVLGVVAAALAGVVFWQNATYWALELARDANARNIALVVSVAAGIVKLGAPAAMKLLRAKWRHFPGVAIAFLAALGFDLWSSAGYYAKQRSIAALEAQEIVDERHRLETEISSREKKLEQIPEETRQPGPIETELSAARKQVPKSCATAWRATQDYCQRVFALETELANAVERKRIEGELAPLRLELARLPAARQAEPQIATVAAWLRTIGLPVSDAAAGHAWTVLVLLFLEIAPVALIAFVFTPPPPAPVTLEAPKRSPPAGDTAAARKRPARSTVSGDVLALLQRATPGADGWIETTQQAIADQIGTSKTEVCRQLQDLEAKGIVEAIKGRRGTRVRLIGQRVVNLRAV